MRTCMGTNGRDMSFLYYAQFSMERIVPKVKTIMSDGNCRNRLLVAAWRVFLAVVLSLFPGCNFGDRAENYAGAPGIPTERTGILIASDGSYSWALVSGTELYPLRGDRSELTKYE